MINCDLLTKLIKVKDKIKGKIIFLGDPAQLPPVNEANSLIFYTNDIPKFRLKEIMRYKGPIVDLCDNVRNLVFDDDTKIKFKDFKTDKIKLFKKFDKSIQRYLKFIESGHQPIYLVYTNRQCDIVNSIVRKSIFNNTKNRYEPGELILFNNYYKSQKETYYTSQQMYVERVEEEIIDLSQIDIQEIFKTKKVIEPGLNQCCLCRNKVERDSLCGCKLCNQCIKEWLNTMFVCPSCFISIDNDNIELKMMLNYY